MSVKWRSQFSHDTWTSMPHSPKITSQWVTNVLFCFFFTQATCMTYRNTFSPFVTILRHSHGCFCIEFSA